jgi:glycosyltransferase involved in cell wall biosynthesis
MYPRIVVVNDCAHVFEDLIPLLTDQFDVEFIQRTRGFWSKTFGIFWKILTAEGNLFHVNYALQDAYITDKFRHHLDILHVHGSDVRSTINTRAYGWIVKSNLRNAKKVVYSTPDLENNLKTIRDDAIYLPNPVRIDKFQMKTDYNEAPKALYFKLNYEELPSYLANLLASNGIHLTVMQKNIPYSKMADTLRSFDIFIDRFSISSFSKTCLEAMSCGLATIDYRHRDDFYDKVVSLKDPSNVRKEGEVNRKYILENHDAKKVADKLATIWREF